MKQIEAFPANGTGRSFLLGDNTQNPGAGRGFTLDASFNFEADGELVSLSQSESRQSFDRMNESSEATVTVDIGFSTEDDRDDWMIGLQDAVPRIAHVKFSTTRGDRWMPNATTRPMSVIPVGDVAARLTITFRGQKMQGSRPANRTDIT